MNSAREPNPPPPEVHIIFPRLSAGGNLWHAGTRQNTQLNHFCLRAKPCYIGTSLSHRRVTCNIPKNYEERDATHGG